MKRHITYREIATKAMESGWGPTKKYPSARDAIHDTEDMGPGAMHGNHWFSQALQLDIARSLRKIVWLLQAQAKPKVKPTRKAKA